MIFVPDKEKINCWYNFKGQMYLNYSFDENVIVNFQWRKDKNEYDPFYLFVESVVINDKTINVLKCTLFPCNSLPQLRYNDIIKKWFCSCPSSMLGAKNNDESQLQQLKNIEFNEQNGFCDTPFNAILMWNKIMAQQIIKTCDDYLKKDSK